ncbi:hypothetical protein BJ508DRAFT_176340 [Ascobolus immersus RN42]|uniref:Uncharacterized protein n=1 Tax=Ascobolus immersus RN42 TaxID=1160509 RepID=A0A3N4IV20_ASCIM|nr:hypothetical protein BJ508DRAFT_176340 [Ascobolus immersus RN42]
MRLLYGSRILLILLVYLFHHQSLPGPFPFFRISRSVTMTYDYGFRHHRPHSNHNRDPRILDARTTSTPTHLIHSFDYILPNTPTRPQRSEFQRINPALTGNRDQQPTNWVYTYTLAVENHPLSYQTPGAFPEENVICRGVIPDWWEWDLNSAEMGIGEPTAGYSASRRSAPRSTGQGIWVRFRRTSRSQHPRGRTEENLETEMRSRRALDLDYSGRSREERAETTSRIDVHGPAAAGWSSLVSNRYGLSRSSHRDRRCETKHDEIGEASQGLRHRAGRLYGNEHIDPSRRWRHLRRGSRNVEW